MTDEGAAVRKFTSLSTKPVAGKDRHSVTRSIEDDGYRRGRIWRFLKRAGALLCERKRRGLTIGGTSPSTWAEDPLKESYDWLEEEEVAQRPET